MSKLKDLYNESSHLNDSGVSLYVDALRLEREEDLPLDILTHVENCFKCREAIFQYHQFMKDEDLDELKYHPYFDNGNHNKETVVVSMPLWKVTSIAAGIIILIVFSYLFLKNTEFKGNSKDIIISENDSTNNDQPEEKKLKKEELITKISEDNGTIKNSVPNDNRINSDNKKKKEPEVIKVPKLLALNEPIPYLDRQIMRASNSRGVKVKKPIQNAILHDFIIFEWDEAQENDILLEVFTKKTQNDPIKFSIPSGTTNFKLPQSLTPDLYYWTLKEVIGEKKKRIGIGKFYVKKNK